MLGLDACGENKKENLLQRNLQEHMFMQTQLFGLSSAVEESLLTKYLADTKKSLFSRGWELEGNFNMIRPFLQNLEEIKWHRGKNVRQVHQR